MEPLDWHDLYLAPTRPSMKWGVPAEGFLLNLFGLYFLSPLVAQGNPYWLIGGWLLGVPVHLVMRFHANKNPNFWREVRMWFLTVAGLMEPTLWNAPEHWSKDEEIPILV